MSLAGIVKRFWLPKTKPPVKPDTRVLDEALDQYVCVQARTRIAAQNLALSAQKFEQTNTECLRALREHQESRRAQAQQPKSA